jgi:fatty acid synthase subunit alpha, fungi type
MGEPVDDKDVQGRYEKEIMNHAGVCFIGEPIYINYMPALTFLIATPEPELFCGYDPKHKIFNLGSRTHS